MFLRNVHEMDFNEVVERGTKKVAKPPKDGIYLDKINQKLS